MSVTVLSVSAVVVLGAGAVVVGFFLGRWESGLEKATKIVEAYRRARFLAAYVRALPIFANSLAADEARRDAERLVELLEDLAGGHLSGRDESLRRVK